METPDQAAPKDAATPTCPSCGAAVGSSDVFCESCGGALSPTTALAVPPETGDGSHTELITPPPAPVEHSAPSPVATRACASCGANVANDGYCSVCGTKALSERDHWSEHPVEWVAAVCDKGIRHVRNEDAMACAAEPAPGSFAALVVCDGVSTAPSSDIAALAASRAARDVLATARTTEPAGGPASRIVFWTGQLEAAGLAAQEAAAAVAATVDPAPETPSCTFVSAVVAGHTITAGWVGDSRAYWLPDGAPGVQLSVDDSWATEQLASGVSRAVAEADPRCHQITRWLGVDAPDPLPRCASVAVDSSGWLLVCSDGLWNYCSSPADLRALIDTAVGDGASSPLEVADALVAFANGEGGQDNITASLARVPAPVISALSNSTDTPQPSGR